MSCSRLTWFLRSICPSCLVEASSWLLCQSHHHTLPQWLFLQQHHQTNGSEWRVWVSPQPSPLFSTQALSLEAFIQSHGVRHMSRLMTFKSLSSTLLQSCSSFSLEPQTPGINSFLLEYLVGYFQLSTHSSLHISSTLTPLGSASLTC